MKKTLLLCFCCFLIADSEAQWEKAYGDEPSIRYLVIKDSIMIGAWEGVYKSTNNGMGWRKSSAGLPDGILIVSLLAYNDKIFAGANTDFNKLYGLWISSDNGETWQIADQNFKNVTVWALIQKQNQIFAATHGRGVWRSNDNGLTWNEVNNGLSNVYAKSLTLMGNDIIVGTNGGIFMSSDNGDSWKVLYNESSTPSTLSVYACGNSIFAHVYGSSSRVIYSADKGDTWNQSQFTGVGTLYSDGINVFYLSFRTLYRSTDQGVTWEIISNNAHTILTKHNSILYGSQNTYSPDDGVTWKQLGAFITDIEAYSSCMNGENLFLSGYDDFGSNIYYSTDIGFSWGVVDLHDLKNPQVRMFYAVEDTIFVPTDNGIYSTWDYGNNWNLIDSNMTQRIWDLKFSGSVVLIRDDNSYWISWDQGRNWKVLPFSTIESISGNDELVFINVWGADYGYKDFRSSDHGATWEEIIIQNQHGRYLLFNGYVYAFSSWYSGLFRSSDKGNTWDKLDLPIVYSMTHDSSNLYISIGAGTCKSSDNGDTWEVIAPFQSGELMTNGEYLFSGIGLKLKLHETTLIDNDSHPIAEKYSLLQNYPNPFNPATTINYTIPVESFVELKIYDLLGREAAVLVNKEQSAGEYSVQFNASSLPSGVYVYSIRAGEYKQAKKLILMR